MKRLERGARLFGWNLYRWDKIGEIDLQADESNQSTEVVVLPSYHYLTIGCGSI